VSNYLSKTYQVQAPQDYSATQIAAKVAYSMQGKYDQNKSQIDQTLALYTNQLKGLRDVDNEYIAEKLKQVKSAIKEYSVKNGDLSRNYNKDSILTAVTSVMDDTLVQDALSSYQNASNYDKEYAEIIKKTPGAANNANYAYGKFKGGYQDYMEGKTNKLGKMQYTAYTDLAEEDLKKLKTIKDIKGKRFIEQPDGKGGLIRRELDGLLDSEINSYLGSTMSSQELQQMRINAWAKFGGNSIESNRIEIEGQYTDYNKQQTEILKKERDASKALSESNVSDDKKEKARRRVKELEESISDIANIDTKKLDTVSIASSLEKVNYLNGMSQLAKAEWSTEYKKDDVYFETQKIAIDLERLGIEKQKLDIEKQEFAFSQYKFQKEQKLDADGNKIPEEVVSQTTQSAELEKELQEGGTGQASIKVEHDNAHKAVLAEASNFLKDANDTDIKVIKTALATRGIEVVGNSFKFINAEKNKNESLVSTVYATFKQAGLTNPAMYKSFEIKQQKAIDLINVRREGYSKVFNADPDKYIESLKKEINNASRDGQSDLFAESASEDLSKATKAQAFVNENGGWNNLKINMQKNPQKLQQFSEVLGVLTDRKTRTVTLNTTRNDLKKDASIEIERNIQKKTKDGVMMSAYNQFNVIDKKVKEDFLSRVVTQDIEEDSVKGQANFDPKQNITIRKQGEDVYIEQTKVTGSGDKEQGKALRYKVSKQSDLYLGISKYIDLDVNSNQSIKAEKNTKFEPIKVELPSYGESDSNQQIIKSKANKSVPTGALKGFITEPARFATKELASETIESILVTSGVSIEKAKEYRDKVLANIGGYKLQTVVKENPASLRNEFVMQITRPDGTQISDTFLGIDKMGYELKYSMETYPQMYVLNHLLFTATRDVTKIDNQINKL
jgi:hypothetical protein